MVTQSMVGIQLPSIQMTCQSFLDYVQSINQSPNYYCLDSNLGKTCCQTCKSKHLDYLEKLIQLIIRIFEEYNAMNCIDSYFDCPKFKPYCVGASLGGVPLNTICKRTCSFNCLGNFRFHIARSSIDARQIYIN